MKKKGPGEYFIAGGVTAVIAFFVIPWFDMLGGESRKYTDGLNIVTAVIALAAGGLFAFSIYSSDRKKELAQDAVPPEDLDEKEEETDREID